MEVEKSSNLSPGYFCQSNYGFQDLRIHQSTAPEPASRVCRKYCIQYSKHDSFTKGASSFLSRFGRFNDRWGLPEIDPRRYDTLMLTCGCVNHRATCSKVTTRCVKASGGYKQRET